MRTWLSPNFFIKSETTSPGLQQNFQFCPHQIFHLDLRLDLAQSKEVRNLTWFPVTIYYCFTSWTSDWLVMTLTKRTKMTLCKLILSHLSIQVSLAWLPGQPLQHSSPIIVCKLAGGVLLFSGSYWPHRTERKEHQSRKDNSWPLKVWLVNYGD